MTPVTVMKFGGTSVGSAERIRAVAERARERRAERPLVVVSALSGITDLLIKGARLALERNADHEDVVNEIVGRHHATILELFPSGPAQTTLLDLLERVVGELQAYYSGVFNLGELTARSLDAISAMGERLSHPMVAAALAQAGLASEAVDAREVVVTDEAFGQARPLFEDTTARARARLLPLLERGVVPVLPGFIGATRKGVTTTLGRGGSDWSASIVGAVLQAREIQIWTDVDGIMTVDPRLVKSARVLPEVSFAEAAELAYFGAKVLHPATIRPAVDRGIPVRILNSLDPGAPGTRISGQVEGGRGEARAIAFKKGISVVLISQPRMLMAYGFVARVFEVFDRHRTPVDLIATSEVSISLTVDDVERLGAVEADLAGLGEVTVLRDLAIVSVVGRGFIRQPGLAARVFAAVREVNVVMISFGASDVNVSFVVAAADAERAVKLLHRDFFEEAAS